MSLTAGSRIGPSLTTPAMTEILDWQKAAGLR
jgi:hypothetical protein